MDLLTETPKVSIITVVLNRANVISRCIDSVFRQTYSKNNIEHIVVDGGSTDGTAEILKNYLKMGQISILVSEKDKGIYDAMNKGIKLATGDIVAFLNSDDWYEKNTIEDSVNAIIENDSEYSYGNCQVYDKEDKEVLWTWCGDVSGIYFGTPFSHQTLFCKRSVYEKIGGFDLQFQIGADYDFMIKLVKEKYKYSYINKVLVNASSAGVSWAPEVYKAENKKIHSYHVDFILDEVRRLRNEVKNLKHQLDT